MNFKRWLLAEGFGPAWGPYGATGEYGLGSGSNANDRQFNKTVGSKNIQSDFTDKDKDGGRFGGLGKSVFRRSQRRRIQPL